MTDYVVPNILDLTVKVSLPLLVRDWLVKRCPKQDCFYIREYHELVFDPLHGVNENTLDNLVVTSKSSHWVVADYILDVTKTEVIVEGIVDKELGPIIRKRTLNWRAPSFWQQLGKVIKCSH